MTQRRIGLALLAAGNALFIAGIAVGGATTGETLSLSGASLMLVGHRLHAGGHAEGPLMSENVCPKCRKPIQRATCGCDVCATLPDGFC